MLVTVGGESGVQVSVCGEEMKGPLQIRRARCLIFQRKWVPERKREKTYLPKVAKQVEVNMTEST